MRCLSCKYDLRNLTEHRCPECGRAFDPDNPASFIPFTTRSLRSIIVTRCSVTFVVAIILVLAITQSDAFVRPSLIELVLFALFATFLAFPVLLLFAIAEQRKSGRSH